jgi:thiosulfate dehydrogenase [quinone] large subunit
MSANPESPSLTSESLSFLTLRLWLGFRALATGIEKFSGTVTVQQPILDADGKPDASGAIVEIEQKVYGFTHYRAVPDSLETSLSSQPLLPSFLTHPFYAVLGYALIALGLMLLLGVKTRLSLFAMGLLYTGLTFGLILIKQDPGVAWLGIHVGLIALALKLSPHNRFAITKS